MRILPLALLLLLLALLGVPIAHYQVPVRHATATNAFAADTFRFIYSDNKQTHTTGTSGYKGTKQDVREPGSSAFLQGLEFDEKSDKPCFIRAHWWRYTADSLRENFTTLFDICKGDAKGDQSLIFNSTDTLRQAVTSIRVCSNNDKDHRLKGVELTGGYVDRNGSGRVENSDKKLSFDRPNCASWKTTQRCPTGMVANGLIVEHSGEEITGLGITCTKPVVTPATPAENSLVAANERFSKMEKDIRVSVDKNGKSETMTITEAVARHEVNGVTVAVIDNRQVSTVRHYGVRSRKSNLSANKDTLYQAASTSKFVAAIGMLIAAGKGHGPNLKQSIQMTANANEDSLIDRWRDRQFKGDKSGYPKDITVERLLSHTAGLDTHGIGTARINSKTDMENILLGQVFDPGVKPFSLPGVQYSYSGGGFVVAEAMLELHSGRSATDFLNLEVLRHFGMTKSTFNTANDGMTNLARGCSRGICSDTPEYTTVKFAGGLLANPEEYARLLTIIMNDGKDSSGKQLLPLADVQRLMTPAARIESSLKPCAAQSQCYKEKCYGGQCLTPISAEGAWYGLGVSLDDGEDYQGFPRRLYHGGSQDNARAFFYLDRANGNGIVVMVNGEYDWKKNGVEYGAEALEADITDAFHRNFP